MGALMEPGQPAKWPSGSHRKGPQSSEASAFIQKLNHGTEGTRANGALCTMFIPPPPPANSHPLQSPPPGETVTSMFF